MVEDWTEYSELVGFVILPVYDKVLVQDVLESLDLGESVAVVLLAVLQVEGPLGVEEGGPPCLKLCGFGFVKDGVVLAPRV